MSIIPHSRPTLCSDDVKAVSDTISSGQISASKQVDLFEKKLARYVQMKYACAVSSGTAALHLSLLALDIKKGDEVILPTHVCPALLNAVQYTGAAPKVVDVCYEDANISPEEVKKKLTRKTKAILVPHMFGEPADLGALLKLGVPVIEDCAQSLGALYKGRPVGSFGLVSVFSFYATKMLTTGQGGMVVSNNKKIIDRVVDLSRYDHKPEYTLRFNYQMTDMQASMGVTQLEKLPYFLRVRRMMTRYYSRVFSPLDISLPEQNLTSDPAWYRYVVKTNRNADGVIKSLKKKGIMAERPLFRPIHQYLGLKAFPISDRLMKESVSLPIYPSLPVKDLEKVTREFRNIFDKR